VCSGPGHWHSLAGTVKGWESIEQTDDSQLARIELVAFEGNGPLANETDISVDRRTEFEARLAVPGAKWWWLEPRQAGSNELMVRRGAEQN